MDTGSTSNGSEFHCWHSNKWKWNWNKAFICAQFVSHKLLYLIKEKASTKLFCLRTIVTEKAHWCTSFGHRASTTLSNWRVDFELDIKSQLTCFGIRLNFETNMVFALATNVSHKINECEYAKSLIKQFTNHMKLSIAQVFFTNVSSLM